MAVDGIFFDTSVLIGGLIKLRQAEAAPPQALMDALSAGTLGRCRTAWHCCLEFYSVATRLPAEVRLSPQDALRLVEEEIFGRFDIFQLPASECLSMLRATVHDGVIGGRIYDAHIAEIARSAGATLVLTENRRHFLGLLRHGIKVQTAAEFLQTLEAEADAVE
jgi:predicted nucleic acid-binding protein